MMQSDLLKRTARVALLTIFPMAAAAGTVLATTTTVTVRGTVFDGRTTRPVAGSKIVVSDEQGLKQRVTSDAHGRYSAVGLSAGNITIVAETAGFMSDRLTCLVEPGTSASFNLGLQRGSASVTHTHTICPMQSQTQDSTTR